MTNLVDYGQRATGGVVFAIVVLLAFGGVAQAQMPDPRQMSGIPLPAPELPDGTISVRVIRGQISNNLTGQPVELLAGGKTLTQNTDTNGRAQFAGIAEGTSLTASTTVDGVRIESRPFAAPASGGVRLMLVAGLDGSDKAAGAAPTPGTVVLGQQSRFIVELSEGAVRVYLLVEVLNPAAAPVQTKGPLVFDLPTGAQGTTILEGSTPQASVDGARVIVRGPFQPGATPLQVAYMLPYTGSRLTIAQPLPVALQELSVIVQKTGEMSVTSPQITEHREQAAGGETYMVGGGPSIPAGTGLTIEVSGLPHHSAIPRNTALALAILVLGIGGWAAFSKPTARRTLDRDSLLRRRESLFGDLVRLERSRRQGRIADERYRSERRAAIRELERLYDALEPVSVPAPVRERPGPMIQESA